MPPIFLADCCPGTTGAPFKYVHTVLLPLKPPTTSRRFISTIPLTAEVCSYANFWWLFECSCLTWSYDTYRLFFVACRAAYNGTKELKMFQQYSYIMGLPETHKHILTGWSLMSLSIYNSSCLPFGLEFMAFLQFYYLTKFELRGLFIWYEAGSSKWSFPRW